MADREPSDAPPGSQHPCVGTQRHNIHPRVFWLPYRHSRRLIGSTWVGSIHAAALNRLKLPTVTPGATTTWSASSVSLILCRYLGIFSSSLIHAAMHLQPPLDTVLYQAAGSSVAVLEYSVMSNTRRSSTAQSVHSFSSPTGPRFSACSSSPDMMTILEKPMVFMYVHMYDHHT